MQRGSSLPWVLLAMLFLRSRSAEQQPQQPAAANEVATTRTGEPMPGWFHTRFEMARQVLAKAFPTAAAPAVNSTALSIVAQWAHETARGEKEFNFNLGGWTARKRDTFFRAKGAAPTEGMMVWTAYPSLPVAATDQIRRLFETYPSAWKLLTDNPLSSAWVEELGRRGYYTGSRDTYARAWAMHRAELRQLVESQAAA